MDLTPYQEERLFDLRIRVDENATVEQSANKTFSSKVVINTKMIPNYYDREYARIDCGESSPGYFTYKGSLGDTAAYCASLN